MCYGVCGRICNANKLGPYYYESRAFCGFSSHSPAKDLVSVYGVVGGDLMGFGSHDAVVKRCWWWRAGVWRKHRRGDIKKKEVKKSLLLLSNIIRQRLRKRSLQAPRPPETKWMKIAACQSLIICSTSCACWHVSDAWTGRVLWHWICFKVWGTKSQMSPTKDWAESAFRVCCPGIWDKNVDSCQIKRRF